MTESTARRPALALSAMALLLLATACGRPYDGTTSTSRDATPTNRSSGPRPTADSPTLGGGGGPGVGDTIGSGSGITGAGGAAGP